MVGLDDVYAFGLLAMSCSPGGGGSNSWAYLLEGDLDLSVSMTFFSTILSVGESRETVFTVCMSHSSVGDNTVKPLKFACLLSNEILWSTLNVKLNGKKSNIRKYLNQLNFMAARWLRSIFKAV